MTKLNHNRPLLRYLDNIRREMAINARRTDTLSFGDCKQSASNLDCEIFPLTSAESRAVSVFFESIENYLDVESKLICAIMPGASRQAKAIARQVNRDAAESHLKASAGLFVTQMVLSGLASRMNLLNLYRKLEKELRQGSESLWELINDVAMKHAMQKIAGVIGIRVLTNAPDT